MARRAARALLAACLATACCTAGVAAAEANNPDNIEAAGCLVVTPDGFVMGINRLINRLQLPAGRHLDGESAAQTAARETREETGLAVEVGEIALSLEDGRVLFFFCTPVNGPVEPHRLAPTDRVEVSRVLVVNPVTMTTPDGAPVTTPWRFPEMHWLLRTLFSSVSASQR